MDDLTKLNQIFNKWNASFNDGGFHNFLWQLIINKAHENKIKALFPAIAINGYELGLVISNSKGYIRTSAFFLDHDFHVAQLVCDELNKDIFNLSIPQANDIVLSSMFA